MNQSSPPPTQPDEQSEPWCRWLQLGSLVLILVALCEVYYLVNQMSGDFAPDTPLASRPIPKVLMLFAVAFALYLGGLLQALRLPSNATLVSVIFVGAILVRLALLYSVPIQEIDIYRYLWDGEVTRHRVNPYRYPPNSVKEAARSGTKDPQLQRLVQLRNDDPALAEILDQVHFGNLPTIYPPVSQLVFASAGYTTPDGSTARLRLNVMKTWLAAFDLGTLVIVMLTLRTLDQHQGWSIAYGWCPLLLKEITNSGHLDTIAVFLVAWSVYIILRATRFELPAARGPTLKAAAAAVLLALGVGAKLYPVLLAPVLAVWLLGRTTWRCTGVFVAVFCLVTVIVLMPMFYTPSGTPPTVAQAAEPMAESVTNQVATDSIQTDPSLGLRTFLNSWEMNDFLFLVVVENLKPQETLPTTHRAWFAVMPASVREPLVNGVAKLLGVEPRRAPYLATKVLLTAIFLAIAVGLVWRAARRDESLLWGQTIFLILAWFWLLCPTQNPWYWTWTLPFLPLMRNRLWLAVSGLGLLYYLRFWFDYQWGDQLVGPTPYPGAVFFDMVVPWIEFGPWLVLLAVLAFWRRRQRRTVPL